MISHGVILNGAPRGRSAEILTEAAGGDTRRLVPAASARFCQRFLTPFRRTGFFPS